ncbi:MAG: SDR family oxidoreductase [Actinomycetia bacterium]|nr:SDR family oxidoreductase [Actinomycetes bacterium]MCH9708824.1 SDR family oxidoreductase [Actinomycetes bacterium]
MAGPPDVTGRCAIVTGSSAGIGFASAQRLAEAGADIVLNARDGPRLSQAVDRIAATYPVRVAGVPGDAASSDVIAELISTAADWGGANIAVANAGGGTDDLPVTEQDAARLWRNNVWTTEALIGAVSPAMTQRGWGRIVTVSSVAGRHRSPTSVPAYAAAKAGVVALTRSAAHELAPYGVTVNCVAPGVIATDRIVRRVSRMPEERSADIRAQIPLGRLGEPDEVAAAISFLCGSEAGFITGHTLDVNGGAWMN